MDFSKPVVPATLQPGCSGRGASIARGDLVRETKTNKNMSTVCLKAFPFLRWTYFESSWLAGLAA